MIPAELSNFYFPEIIILNTTGDKISLHSSSCCSMDYVDPHLSGSDRYFVVNQKNCHKPSQVSLGQMIFRQWLYSSSPLSWSVRERKTRSSQSENLALSQRMLEENVNFLHVFRSSVTAGLAADYPDHTHKTSRVVSKKLLCVTSWHRYPTHNCNVATKQIWREVELNYKCFDPSMSLWRSICRPQWRKDRSRHQMKENS